MTRRSTDFLTRPRYSSPEGYRSAIERRGSFVETRSAFAVGSRVNDPISGTSSPVALADALRKFQPVYVATGHGDQRQPDAGKYFERPRRVGS